MGLNIVANRKYSLKGFAEGWDDAFIIVRAANREQRKRYEETTVSLQQRVSDMVAMEDRKAQHDLGVQLDAETERVARELALELTVKGKVIDTSEDGRESKLVDFGSDDAPVVLEALSFAWINDLVAVAMGADRLKAQTK